MKRKNIILISLFLIMALINTGIVFAEDFKEVNLSDNLDKNQMIIDEETIDNQENIINGLPYKEEVGEDSEAIIDDYECISDENNDHNNLKGSNLEANNLESTIYVEAQKTNQNQMTDPTIQNAINSANAGDTIIIKGQTYAHCHFIVNKTLTIISETGTLMTPCPSNTQGSRAHGIFYITPEASGTIIKGFTLMDDDEYTLENDYGIYINGASNVQIINCTIESGIADGIRVTNGTNTKVTDSLIKDSNIGINIINSSQTTIKSNEITNNTKTGIFISGSTRNTTIDANNITYNQATGINIVTADHIYILNNYISFNQKSGSGAGVYVNCNITKIEILGNLFRQNGQYGILNDYRTRNMDAKKGAEKLEVVDNNYFMGHTERTVYHIDYVEYPGGPYTYDSTTDTYTNVGNGNGNYDIDKSTVYLGYAFLIDETICGATLYKAPNTGWSENGNRNLMIGEITQVKKGTYQIAITNASGSIATDFNSIYVTFYLNKNNTESSPQEGDVYKTVLIKDGVATVSFSEKDYLESGNVLLAVFPGLIGKTNVDPHATFNIADDQLPKDSINTKITVSNMNTYPNSGATFTATLKDEYGNPLAGKTIKISLNGNTLTRTSDSKGKVSLPIKLASEKTYTISLIFNGDDEYNKTSAKASIVVKKTGQKIVSSNKAFAPNKASYYSITLKDENNKAIANKYVKFTINRKTYSVKTNSKGIAKVKIKLSVKKKYKISIKSAATKKYRAMTKTNYITIKALKQKISSSNVRYAPKSVNYYSISLKDQNNIAIANKKITVKIGTKTYSKKTNSKGTVKIKINYSKKGTYKVTIKSPKTKQYIAKSKANKIVITSLKQKIVSSNKKFTPKASGYYNITLKDENNKAIPNKAVKFTLNKKTYTIKTNSKGIARLKINLTGDKAYALKISSPKTNQYKAMTKTNNITVTRGSPKILSYNRTYSKNTEEEYSVYLSDYAGKKLSGEKISFEFDSRNYTALTDANGMAKFIVNMENPGTYQVISKFLGNTLNKAISVTNTITIKDATNTKFVDKNLPNSEIQKIIDSSNDEDTIEFLGDAYNNVKLNIDKSLNIKSEIGTVLNGAPNSLVISINADNVNVSSLIINPKESDGIAINNSKDVNVFNNTIINSLNQSKINDYNNGSTLMPGTGIRVLNCENILISKNTIKSFESGLYNEYSNNLSIEDNEISLNNYGIKYGFETSNTLIRNNQIIDNIGWYIMDEPEGPRGYGIFLNNSAVNVTIKDNNISNNYLGISIDSNNSTGIVITSNLIADNSLEGIRFNAPYDLAENAIEPIVTDNAIYRNAEGPSMMILGEMSANPFGIYGPGAEDESLRLKIGPNWYGVNSLRTWDYDTGIVGVGTMCPRIKAEVINFTNIEMLNLGTYKISFYKDGELATSLASFDIYATLNRGTDKETEVHFNVINGTGNFSFEKNQFSDSDNKIEISVGSLINIVDRIYTVVYTYNVPESEIPV